MRLPRFLRRGEQRTYTDTLIAHLLNQVESTPSAMLTAVVETVSGLYGRAFMSATVTGTDAVPPALLGQLGRSLIRGGEFVAALDTDGAEIVLIPASDWDVIGSSPLERHWRYRCDLPSPSGLVRRDLPSAGIVHVKYAVDPAQPWIGLSPITIAKHSGKLLANLETSLEQESGSPVGYVLPLPQSPGNEVDDAENDPLAGLRTDLAKLRGGLAMVESTATGFNEQGVRQARADDWISKRFGPAIPDTSVTLREQVIAGMLSAAGVHPALASAAAQGTSLRESYRQFVVSTVAPLATVVSAELTRKLETPVTIQFDELRHADVAARARAYKQFRDSELDDAVARELSGLAS